MLPQLHMLLRRRTTLLTLLTLAGLFFLLSPHSISKSIPDVATLRATLCPPIPEPELDRGTCTGNFSFLAMARKNLTAVPQNAMIVIGGGANEDNEHKDEEEEGEDDDAPLLIMPQFPSIMVDEYLEIAAAIPGYTASGGISTLTEQSKVAIVTFLDEDLEHNGEDYYFINTRMLTYQLLIDAKTGVRAHRRQHIYWIVAVGRLVSEAKREQLRRDGAQIIEIEDIPGLDALNSGDARWAHVMNKLRLFEWEDYERILFLDADMVLMGPVDDLFYISDSVHPKKTFHQRSMPNEEELPDEYVFVARPDLAYMGGNNHPYPDDPMMTSMYFNAGFWLIAPDKKLFNYFMSLINTPEEIRPFTVQMPEQNLLNYAFRHCDFYADQELRCKVGAPLGPMPWSKAEAIWSSNRPSLLDYSFNVRALHYKGWEMPEDYPLKTLWEDTRKNMEKAFGIWSEKEQKALEPGVKLPEEEEKKEEEEEEKKEETEEKKEEETEKKEEETEKKEEVPKEEETETAAGDKTEETLVENHQQTEEQS